LSELPFDIGRHKWLRLLLASVALYLVLLPLWWYSLEWLASLTGAAANFVYGLFDPDVSITPRGNTVAVEVTATAASGFGGQKHSSAVRLSTVTYGLPMLLALVLVTRADSILAKLRALGAGALVMILLTIPAVMAWAKLTSLQLYDEIAREMGGNVRGSDFIYYGFHGYAFSQPVVAVLVWLALMAVGLFRRKPRREAAVARVARNALCPCGSGRKYKKCCGRVDVS
jgi:hypothetical protein